MAVNKPQCNSWSEPEIHLIQEWIVDPVEFTTLIGNIISKVHFDPEHLQTVTLVISVSILIWFSWHRQIISYHVLEMCPFNFRVYLSCRVRLQEDQLLTGDPQCCGKDLWIMLDCETRWLWVSQLCLESSRLALWSFRPFFNGMYQQHYQIYAVN